jgi:serine/threonine protein kinase/TolA-binding protein
MDDRNVLEHFPLPIARGYRRYLNALEVRERHDAAYFLFEIYLKYLASIAIASYLAGEAREHRVNAALKGLARPSLGEWLRFLRECLKFLAEDRAAGPVVTALHGIFTGKDRPSPEAASLYNALRSLRGPGPSQKVEVTLEMLLGELVTYRNRVLGHGAPLGADHYQKFTELFAAACREALDRSPFLTACRLVYFNALKVEQGARVEVSVTEFMGDQPVRRQSPLVISYGAAVPHARCLYLLLPDGGHLSLDPLLVAHQEDVYFLNEAEGAPEYLSYSSGARHRPADLVGTQGELFQRILGYEVQGERLSRIGNDLIPADRSPSAAGAADGERRLGDYRIIREVGRGAMGTIFEAVQESLGRRVALKVLPGNFALDPKRVERFRREARATARIHHPSIIPVYEVGEAGGTHYYAMDFLDGPSLDKILEEARKAKPSSASRKGSSTSDPAYIAGAVEQIAAVAEGLHQAHLLGLVHRDVKPSNILVDSSGRYVLVDFGLVHEESAQTLTRSGEMVGTLSYMSPEQVSRRKVDARSDVYSLGATLYEVLTLRPPFEGQSDHQVQNGILFEEAIAPRKLNPRLNRDLETIILRALEKHPERRYASAEELAADLTRFLRYEPIQARPLSALARLSRRARRHRLALSAAAVIFLLLASLGWLGWASLRANRARLLAEYEPLVARALMKIQTARLMMTGGRGDSLAIDPRKLLEGGDVGGQRREVGGPTVEEALRDLELAAAASPARPDAHFHRAKGLLLIGHAPEALGALEDAIACDPGFVPAVVLRADLLRQEGKWELARGEVERAGKSAEGSWAKAWLAAHQAMAEENWEKAVEAYTRLIEIEGAGREPYLGSSLETRIGRGLALLEVEDFNRALVDFVTARDRWPDSPEAALLMGKTYYLKGEIQEAERTFLEIHRSSRFPDETALAVAAVYDSLLDREKALGWVESRVKGSLERARSRSVYLSLLDRNDEAAEAAREAIRLNEKEVFCRNSLYWILVGRKAYQEAVQVQRKAVEFDPENDDLRLDLARALQMQNDFPGAEKVCREGLSLHPRGAQYWVQLGRLYSAQGKQREAIESLGEAIRVNPGWWWAYFEWYCILYQQGKADQAKDKLKEFERANPETPVNSWGLFLLGNFHFRREEFNEALSAYAKGFRRHPQGLADNAMFRSPFNSTLRRITPSPEVQAELDRLTEKLEGSAWLKRKPSVLNTLALLYLFHPKKDAARAVEYASQALKSAPVKDSDFLGTLGEARFSNGERLEGIEILEEAVGLPGAKPSLHDRLQSLLSQIRGAPPARPENIRPEARTITSHPVTLSASPFTHPEHPTMHLRSRWQIRTEAGSYSISSTINWQSKRDLESWIVPKGVLQPRTTYFWRVAYTGTNFTSSAFSAESSFITGDFPWEPVPFDISGFFNRDVVANEGDGQNDTFDAVGGLLIVDGFDGRRSDDPLAQGLPRDRRIGVHFLGDYSDKNSLQLRSSDRGSIRIPVKSAKYSAVRFLVSGGNGDSLVPIVFEYSDGTQEEISLPCDDWYDDNPEAAEGTEAGTPQPATGKSFLDQTVASEEGLLQVGSVPVLGNLDRIRGDVFEDVNDPALFEVIRFVRPEKDLSAIVLLAGKAIYTESYQTRFNLFAVTGIRAVGK